jgi:hypothetical protein
MFFPYRDEINVSLKYLSGGYLVSRVGGQRNWTEQRKNIYSKTEILF